MSSEDVNLKLDLNTGGTNAAAGKEEQQPEALELSYRYDALREADVNNLPSTERPTLVTLFGISECGKTTFVGSLFAILRRRPTLLNATFIDSDTLTGFERRVHLRFLSESGQSVIQRTLRKAGSLLNVVISDENGENPHMFIVSDLAGEVYKDAISNRDLVLQQQAVKYADKLVVFVDVEALLNVKTYNSYKSNFKSLLNRFKENNMFPAEAEVFLAFNKCDKISTIANESTQAESGETDETQKEEFLKLWEAKKKSMVEIAKEMLPIADDHILNVNSLGIQVGDEDEGLINLFKHLLRKKETKQLPSAFNWLHNVSKTDCDESN